MPPAKSAPVHNICRYRIKPGRDAEFAALIAKHWQGLHKLGLTTDEPARVYRASDRAGNIAFVEMFSWKSPASIDTAHQTPQVFQMWEPMGSLCDDMEFWHAEPFAPPSPAAAPKARAR